MKHYNILYIALLNAFINVSPIQGMDESLFQGTIFPKQKTLPFKSTNPSIQQTIETLSKEYSQQILNGESIENIIKKTKYQNIPLKAKLNIFIHLYNTSELPEQTEKKKLKEEINSLKLLLKNKSIEIKAQQEERWEQKELINKAEKYIDKLVTLNITPEEKINELKQIYKSYPGLQKQYIEQLNKKIIQQSKRIKKNLLKLSDIDNIALALEDNKLLTKQDKEELEQYILNPQIKRKINELNQINISDLSDRKQKLKVIANIVFLAKNINNANEPNQELIKQLKERPLFAESTYGLITNIMKDEEYKKIFKIAWNTIKNFNPSPDISLEQKVIPQAQETKKEILEPAIFLPKPKETHIWEHVQNINPLKELTTNQPSEQLSSQQQKHIKQTPIPQKPTSFWENPVAYISETLTSVYTTITSTLSSWWNRLTSIWK